MSSDEEEAWSTEGPEVDSDIIPVGISRAMGDDFGAYTVFVIGREKVVSEHVLGRSQPPRIPRAAARAR